MVINGKQIPDKVINNLIEEIKKHEFNPLAKSSKKVKFEYKPPIWDYKAR